MKITVKKSDNVDVILQTSYIDPLSISEMRGTLILALEQEGYPKSYVKDLFNLTLDQAECCEECPPEPVCSYPEESEEATEMAGKTTDFQDKARQIVDVMKNTLGSVKILWVVRDRYEMEEAVQALDLEFFRGFSAQQVEDVIVIKKSVDYSSPIFERFLSVTISTRFYENNFTAVI